MYEYINTKTGARLSSPDLVFGGNWAIYKPKNEEKKGLEDEVRKEEKKEVSNEVKKDFKEETKESKEVETQNPMGEITKKEIMKELDALGVKYNPRDRKDELYKLMMEV